MAIFFALVALLAAKLNRQEPVEALAGRAYVIDGDTISISGSHIRLKGIDAPELTQSCGTESVASACGKVSRQELVRLVGGREVRCEGYGQDKYNRSLATCYVGETNLNRAMIEAGQAISYGEYQDDEAQARKERKGLWVTTFETPQDWRKEHEEMPEQIQPQPNRPADLLDQLFDWINRLLGGLW
ncbi:endonuclease YncB(thermonuclease family) [Phyllobacterium brassicacearum]|nr:endonuclease YncB(thermonuclease family) [Phyllobacterium brassicacearum]